MIEQYIVKKEMQLYDFLREALPHKSKNNIKSFLSNQMVYVNGKLKIKYDTLLQCNDIIEIRSAKNNPFLEILYEDDAMIAISKKSGVLSIATEKEKEKTAYSEVREYIKKKNKNAKIFIVHRLDQDTSGVLLFAKNEKVKDILQENWNEMALTRSYIAIVEGTLEKKKGTIHNFLTENKNLKVYSTKKKELGKEAITHYEVLKEENGLSLVQVYLETGRKNQIRVHMSELGHPVVGDRKYGSTKLSNRLYLHADKIELIHPVTKRKIKIESPTPRSFKKCMKEG